ncbi:MAG: NAD-dependent epimerase/dehydratase family protein [Sphingobium sp.]|jgi:GDP-6-deoxy-D-talose 4-dehydrogenase|uniref:GDP-mannose 4,6-dehydratase n=1 Tax=Sphingobium sp. TaxID=1912891 RepID=UPI000C59B1A2|nr:GDP-mannose 4,6-dehydratase [Sphingobium sp.]MBA4756472.1 GDP-mannose 4,6-dehydratase [Sphingobium sp.]MBS90405.1 GDP-mannose 4,6 dehydratase [Sphingobium sp.]MBU0776425.1 GDP-mannose 4,6-dehydratase [Alphaproteobacteria bacterium]TAJ72061.1 MAG: NAD-dependent epimerase/dehydratase family protein [Sphingobium sp.]
MSRILITGVDGFTGRHLTALLAEQGHEVIGISHSAITMPIKGLTSSHIGDLTDAHALKDILATVRPDKVAHLAAIAFVSHGIVEDIYRTNIVGTRNLLEAISDVGGVEAVLLASSANIYGNRVSGAINETVTPDPINDYAVSKLAMEFVARLYQDALPIIIARPFNYTGVGQATNFVIPKIVDHVRRKANTIELGNLDVARDFSDVRDVVQAYSRLMADRVAIGQIFNICSGEAHSLRDVIAMIRDISGHDFEVTINPSFVRQNEVKMLWGDRSKIDKMTEQGPIHILHDTLKWMLDQ